MYGDWGGLCGDFLYKLRFAEFMEAALISSVSTLLGVVYRDAELRLTSSGSCCFGVPYPVIL